MKPQDYIKHLNNKGIWSFTHTQATEFLSKDITAAIRILRNDGRIIDPARGFYVIIPEEISLTQRLPGDRFINDLMKYYDAPYYVCLLTAALYYGSSHQAPQVFQVMTNPARRDIRVRGNKVVFYKKESILDTPTILKNTPTGYMKLSTPEATILDLIQFNIHIGGIDYVATVISEMLDKLSPSKMAVTLKGYTLPIQQRAGYILEFLGFTKGMDRIWKQVMKEKPIYTPLAAHGKKDRIPKDPRWKIIVNQTIELDI